MTSGILPSDNMDCGTPNSTWTANDWYWQYRCSPPQALSPHVVNVRMPKLAHGCLNRLLIMHRPLWAMQLLNRRAGLECPPSCILQASSACAALHVSCLMVSWADVMDLRSHVSGQQSSGARRQPELMRDDACRAIDLKIPYGDVIGATGFFLNGQETMAQQIDAQGTLRNPFLFAPGEQYCYTNANFNLAAYVVEKVSTGAAVNPLPRQARRPAESTVRPAPRRGL